MSPRDGLVQLHHILDRARQAVAFMSARTRSDDKPAGCKRPIEQYDQP
jgi:hypothetical protein